MRSIAIWSRTIAFSLIFLLLAFDRTIAEEPGVCPCWSRDDLVRMVFGYPKAKFLHCDTIPALYPDIWFDDDDQIYGASMELWDPVFDLWLDAPLAVVMQLDPKDKSRVPFCFIDDIPNKNQKDATINHQEAYNCALDISLICQAMGFKF